MTRISVLILFFLGLASFVSAQSTLCLPDNESIECDPLNNQSSADSWNAANESKLFACAMVVCDSSTITSNYDFSNYEAACGSAGVITVIYTISGCGNSEEVSASLSIEDTLEPSLNCAPDDILIDCATVEEMTVLASEWNATNLEMLQACSFDICSSQVDITSDYDSGNITCDASITVVYIITDDCGNFVEISAIAEVNYGSSNCTAQDITLECSSSGNEQNLDAWNQDNINSLTQCASVGCGPLQFFVSSNYDFSSYQEICGSTGSMVVTYAVLTCNGTYDVSASVTVVDTTPPVVTCDISDVVIECDSDQDILPFADAWNAENITSLESCSSDACSSITVSSDYSRTDITCDNTITVDYTITDDCGSATVLTASASFDSVNGGGGGGNSCGAVGGVLLTIETDTTEVTVCIGDGMSDAVYAKVWEAEGDAFSYIVTDADGNILRISDGFIFQFEGTEIGTNYIYHVSTLGDVTGLEVGSNIADITGCFELSNSIRVNKIDGDCGCSMLVALGDPIAICEGESVTLEADVLNSNVCEILCADENSGTLVEWDMDACHSITNDVDNKDFSELAPNYPNADDCVNIDATYVNVEGGVHSCTIPKEGLGGRAMCFSGSKKCYWKDDSPDALKFSVTLTPENSSTITGLQFYESAPKRFTWYNPDFSEDIDEGPNNYPRFYGLRVTKDGEEIFQQNDIPTTNDWTLEEFDFSDNGDFKVTDSTTFVFELLAYCPAWRNAITYAWDLDNIKLLGGCCDADRTITKVDYEWSTGDTTQTITVTPTEDAEYSVTVTDCMGCVATNTVPIQVGKQLTADLGDDISVCREDLPVTLTQTTGSTSASVEWSTGETGESIEVTESGTYTVTVTGDIACSDTDEIVVTVNDPVDLNLPDNVNPLCSGNTIDLTTLEPSGQTGGTWTNASGETVTTVGAGDYTYTYTDSNGCTTSGQVTISEDNFSFTIADQGPICPDATFDFSTIVPDGVVGDSWDVADQGDGRYTFTGTNANGCTASADFNVSIDNFSITLDAPPVLCVGEMYMLMDQEPVDNRGGTWTDMDGNVVDKAVPGMFTYTVTNDNGCTASDKITFTSSGFQLMQIPDDSVCWGDSILLSTLEFQEQSGGFWKDLNNNVVTYGYQDAFYRYHLFDDENGCADIVTMKIHEKHCHDACDGFTVSVITPDPLCNEEDEVIELSSLESNATSGGTWTDADGTVVTSGGAGMYTYVYTGPEGCIASTQLEIQSRDCIDPCDVFSISFSNPATICNDVTFDLSTLIPSAAAGGEWKNSDGVAVNSVGPGTYTYSVTTAAGCSASADVTISGMDCSDPCEGVSITIENPEAICKGETFNLNDLVSSELEGGKWTNADGDEVLIITAGTYSYNLTTSEGCEVTASVSIEEKDCNTSDCTPSNVSGMYVGSSNCTDDSIEGPSSLTVSEDGTFQIALEDQDGEVIKVGLDGCGFLLPEVSVEILGTIITAAGDGYFSGDTLFLNQLIIQDGDTSICHFVGVRGGITGTPCDDGNPNTENDIEIDDCNCCGTPIAGQVIYVDAEAAGAANGTSWTDAYTDLQEAMQSAQSGQEIWLADGVYLPTQDGNRDAYFNLPSGVDLYGGFQGGESTICQRDFELARSVLSGDLNQDDKVDVINIVPLELLFTGTEENSHYVLRNSQVRDDIKIDGVAITGGVADGSDTAGGGAFLFVNEEDASIEMNNVLVINNQGAGLGGAGRINTRSATILNVKMNRVVFLQNSVEGPALSKGGGMYVAAWEGGFIDLEISNCIFAQNYSQQRGGAVNTEENVKSLFTNNIFGGNKAKDGGAIFDNSGSGDVVYTNNTFYINYADETGGAMVNFYNNGNTTIDLRNSIFFGNATTLAGGPGLDNFGRAANNFAIQNCLFSEVDLATLETEATGMDDKGNNQFAADPLFVDPLNADFTLQSGSPAIDAGVGSFNALMDDIAGKVRSQGAEIDLGANESGDAITCNFDKFDFDLGYAPPMLDEIAFVVEEEGVESMVATVNTFPNPTSDQINVVVNKINIEDEVSLKLYDMSGREMLTQYAINNNKGMTIEYNIPVKDFIGGVYFLRTKVGRFTINKRVIVIK